ncbi:polymer-forming cytoskeletal protein [Chondromyces crocatus]|uniref:Polymer-forming cytoskeletal protein n=1 Tax=Chondromyces crocatus TaxID=52 RepID=A0A0K1EEJ1_CHOCO|nr:polymer-forming cytoskeletal protein [Chondromyces crocatus]AKT39092.1 uncharacterized protein CMC5_032390 [Chondromyces crocatus]
MVRRNALALLALFVSLLCSLPVAAQPPDTAAQPPDTTAAPPAPAATPVESASPSEGAHGAPSEVSASPVMPYEKSDLLFRMGEPLEIDVGKRVGQAVTLGSDAHVAGTVTDDLLVIGGNAVVTGEVLGDVTVVGGQLELGAAARVGNVTLVQSEMKLAPGAAILGQVTRSSGPIWGWGVGWFFWLSASAFVVVCGLVFAALGGRQLAGAAMLLSRRPGSAGLSALALWVGLPLLATLALMSVVGIPIGFAVLFFALPVLWFLGYLVFGAEVGLLLGKWRGAKVPTDHPYVAVAVGLLVMQLVAFVPWIGGLFAFLAGLWGAGALVLRSLRVLQGEPQEVMAA